MFCDEHDREEFSRARAGIGDVLHVASELYIGRSGHPERRLLEHFVETGRDHLLLLHWAASWPEVEMFESKLIASCAKLARVQNQSHESIGKHRSPWNVVYASFRLKSRVKGIPGSHNVERLHWRLRLWPTQVIPCPMILLRARLEQDEAELKRWWSLQRGGSGE